MEKFYWIMKLDNLTTAKQICETLVWMKAQRDRKAVKYAIATNQKHEYLIGLNDYETAWDMSLWLAATKRVKRWRFLAPSLTRLEAYARYLFLPLKYFFTGGLK